MLGKYVHVEPKKNLMGNYFLAANSLTLGGAKLENSSVANLDVYPNPSRDIFNVTFTSEEEQTLTVKVVNMIGEEIFTEELTEFVGQYTKVIDMNNQPKGVYFLEITTSTGGINKKDCSSIIINNRLIKAPSSNVQGLFIFNQ